MGVKRWLLILIAGVLLIGVGSARLAELIDWPTWRSLIHLLRPAFVSPALQATLVALVGCLLVAIGSLGLNRSLLSAFRRAGQGNVVDVVYRHRQRQHGPKVVAIGGGHGLNTLLRGLKEHTDRITAIVTVADDGGSSGRLRRDLGVLPPGDFRNCIAALSDAEGLVSQLLQYRFGEDSGLNGHSFGNLYITAMAAITGSFEAALTETSRVLAVRGRVIPSTLAQVTLCADLTLRGDGLRPAAGVENGNKMPLFDKVIAFGWRQVRGESEITAARGRIHRVYLEPEDAPAYPEVIRAILDADLIVAGPGSLYTSVLPNLLVKELAQALAASPARKVYVCNVATQVGETDGYDVTAHVRALRQHVGPTLFDTVLANHAFPGDRSPGAGADWVQLPAPATVDYRLITHDLVDRQYPWRHDPVKLAQALRELVNT
jgi:uncharacterized cofD-like protein